jgi:hypothetical protein
MGRSQSKILRRSGQEWQVRRLFGDASGRIACVEEEGFGVMPPHMETATQFP